MRKTFCDLSYKHEKLVLLNKWKRHFKSTVNIYMQLHCTHKRILCFRDVSWSGKKQAQRVGKRSGVMLDSQTHYIHTCTSATMAVNCMPPQQQWGRTDAQPDALDTCAQSSALVSRRTENGDVGFGQIAQHTCQDWQVEKDCFKLRSRVTCAD